MSSSNEFRTSKIYYGTKKLMYLFMINMYFLLAVSPFVGYFLFAVENVSLYILGFLGIILGPAVATLFSSVNRFLKGEEGKARLDFQYFYKVNFLQGIFAGAILSLIISISFFDIAHFSKTGVNIITYIFLLIIVVTALISIYVFPIISRINANTKDVVKIALEKMFKNLHLTLAIFGIIAGFVLLVKVLKISLIGFLIGPIALAYIILLLQSKVLKEVEENLSDKYKVTESL